MRICIYLSDACEPGGIGRAASVTANALCVRHAVSVLSYCASTPDAARFEPSVAVERQYAVRRPLRYTLIETAAKLRRYLLQNQIEILICAGEMLAPVCALARHGLPVRVIFWAHANAHVTGEFRFQRQCRAVAVRMADAVVTLTAESQALLEARYRVRRAVHIPNPIDPQLMAPKHDCLQSQKIISVGRLCAAKDFERLVEVAARVLPQHPGWTWDIYGEGEQRLVIERAIARCGLTGRVRLMGAVRDLYARYPDYAVLVMTSRYEGFPMALLEGMACGLPLVAFDVQTGPREIIEHGVTGYLVPPGDTAAMAARISALIDDPDLRRAMAEANLRRRSRFGAADCAARWEALLGVLQ